MDLARVESGETTLSIENIELHSLLNEIFDLVQPVAEKHEIQITHEVSNARKFFVRADRTRLKQVAINLLTNLIKYNQEHGSINISIDANLENQQLRIHILDTSHGIASDKLEEMFEAFSLLGAESSGIEGTGIGLPICNKFMKLMDLKIEVKSELEKGSCFYILITLGEKNSSKQVDESCAENSDFSLDFLDKKETTLLYIEDNSINVDLLAKTIDCHSNLKLLTDPEAQEGIEIAQTALSNLILMDINLHGMDRFFRLKTLKIS